MFYCWKVAWPVSADDLLCHIPLMCFAYFSRKSQAKIPLLSGIVQGEINWGNFLVQNSFHESEGSLKQTQWSFTTLHSSPLSHPHSTPFVSFFCYTLAEDSSNWPFVDFLCSHEYFTFTDFNFVPRHLWENILWNGQGISAVEATEFLLRISGKSGSSWRHQTKTMKNHFSNGWKILFISDPNDYLAFSINSLLGTLKAAGCKLSR